MENSTIAVNNSTSNALIWFNASDSDSNKSASETYCGGELGNTDKIAGGVFYGMVSLFGSLGNIFVVLVICRTPNLRNICGVLIANLAVADLLTSAFAVPVYYYAVLAVSQSNCDSVPLPHRVAGTLLDMFGIASVVTLASLSVDRSFAISSPLKHKTFMTFTKLKVKLVNIWLGAIIYSIARGLFPGVITMEYSAYVASIGLTVCFVIIVTSGVVAILNVRRNSSRVSDLHQNQDGGRISEGMRQRNKQVAKTITLIIILFFVSWTPLAVSRFFNPLFYIDHVSLDFWFLILGCANSAMNPCIYFYRHRNYREALKATLGL
ncbi:Adenosine receptor A2a [Desmophyllum pertusum]|uniref:Adenosine receptor A2a n=1 Tax=Desmophyllum pertusum TaxID=174260 RepID=A0A9X0CFH1_9CNID|nr:Adenosine receptor A2a [Desmophyllum pertusum]